MLIVNTRVLGGSVLPHCLGLWKFLIEFPVQADNVISFVSFPSGFPFLLSLFFVVIDTL